MDYTITFFTRILSKFEFKTEFDRIIKTLEQNHVDEVELLFGWAWGNDYKDWTPFQTKVTDIELELEKPQKQNFGQFGNDDIFIRLPELEIEFLFCHESDIHLSFNNANEIVSSVINSWDLKKLFIQKELITAANIFPFPVAYTKSQLRPGFHRRSLYFVASGYLSTSI